MKLPMKHAARIAALALLLPAVLPFALRAGRLAPGSVRASPGSPGIPDYRPLESRLRDYLARDAAHWSLYFVDLDSGATFGINPDEPVPQASLVKVPLVLYVNRLAAEGRLSWDDRVEYQPDADWRSGAGALQFFAQPGWGYSVRALANLAITVSDNIAKAMLVRRVGAANLIDYMRSLGAAQAHVNGEEATTARDMAAYFQAVLDLARERPDLGDRLLDDLSHTIWHVGLPGRLPPGVRVAHKEGDIAGVSNDAGIVFAEHPYIICILSEGQPDAEAGFARIAEISRMVYDYQQDVYSGR